LAALSLAEAGLPVMLVDRAPGLLAHASGRNGRRLHLGEHYSEDIVSPSDAFMLNTGRLCFLGALQLARRFPFLTSPADAWWQFLPPGSMTTPAQYEEHLAGLRSFHAALAKIDPVVNELFGPSAQRHVKLDLRSLRNYVPTAAAVAGFASRESVIDLARLRREVGARLTSAAALIDIRLQTNVLSVEPKGSGYHVEMCDQANHVLSANFARVVNATWHDIPTLAQAVAHTPARPGTVRLKLLVTARLPGQLAKLPGFYFHRGVYGSHTNAGRGLAIVTAEAISNAAFAPSGYVPEHWRTLIDNGLSGPAGTDALTAIAEAPANDAGSTGDQRGNRALRNSVIAAKSCRLKTADADPGTAARFELACQVIAAYSQLVPIFRTIQPTSLRFSTVVTSEDAHLADPQSPVHRRSFHIEEVSPGFYNFNPGKLTLAQAAADHLCNMIMNNIVSRSSKLDGAINELLREIESVQVRKYHDQT
jgi:FAD dependent oxidoreductase